MPRLDAAHQPSQRLALTVLLLLREGPMHPYELKTTIERRHYDQSLDLRLGSLYHVVGRLEADGLISAGATSREGRRPERTVYALTAAGRAEFDARLREFLADVGHAPTRMTTAVQFLTSLAPDAARELLAARATELRGRLARIREGMAEPGLTRTMLLEWEHTVALAEAELAWVDGVVADLASGALTWSVNDAGVPPVAPPAPVAGVSPVQKEPA